MRYIIADGFMDTATIDKWDKGITFERVETSERVVSLTDIVDEQGLKYRDMYLDFIYELSEKIIKSSALNFKASASINFWWSSRVFEGCNYATQPHIEDVIKLMVLKEYLLVNKPREVHYDGACNRRRLAIEILCRSHRISFSYRALGRRDFGDQRGCLVMWSRTFLDPLKGFGQFCYGYILGLIFRLFCRPASRVSPCTAIFLDIQSHYSASLGLSSLESRYWVGIKELLTQLNHRAHFIHFYVRSDSSPGIFTLIKDIRRQSRRLACGDRHSVVQSYVRILDPLAVLRRSASLKSRQRYVFDIGRESCGFLWPFMEKDFETTFTWSYLVSFAWREAYFRNMTKASKGMRAVFFPQEGQAWEQSLVFEFRRQSLDTKIIGVPHVAAKFWDLRHWYSKKFYAPQNVLGLPLVDTIAVNGLPAQALYKEAGFPECRTIELEALRFLKSEQPQIDSDLGGYLNTILLVGDFIDENTSLVFDLVCQLQEHLPQKPRVVYKPHPNSTFDFIRYSKVLEITVSARPVDELVSFIKVVFSSNRTSAGVEAYIAGCEVVIALDQKKLNSSPLLGFCDVTFCSTVSEAVVDCVSGSFEESEGRRSTRAFFFDDAYLPRWRSYLESL